MTEAEYKSQFESTKDTPYLKLVDEPRVSIVSILENIDHIIMATHFLWRYYSIVHGHSRLTSERTGVTTAQLINFSAREISAVEKVSQIH